MDTERWSIGDLARATGLTVRALRHFDQIGLLSPSERSPGGHRVYVAADVEKLFVVVALRQLGLPLGEIAACIRGDVDVQAAIAQRLERLETQMDHDERLRRRLHALVRALSRDQPVSSTHVLEAMEAMTTRDATTKGEPPDLHLLSLATEATDAHHRRLAWNVVRAFRALGLVNNDFAVSVSRMLQARSTGSDDAAMTPPRDGHVPRFTAVIPIGRHVTLGRAGTVWFSDLELWDGQARLNIRLPEPSADPPLTPARLPGEDYNLLPGRFGELLLIDDVGTAYELSYCLGRGLMVTPAINRTARRLEIRPRHGATFEPVTIDLTAATALSLRPALPAESCDTSAESYMTALVEEALYWTVVMSEWSAERTDDALQSWLERLRLVAFSLSAVGALDDPHWYAEEFENALGGRQPARAQWRRFVQAARARTDEAPRLLAVAADIGTVDGMHVSLRSLEVLKNKMYLHTALTRADSASAANSTTMPRFTAWAETPWRGEDDLGNLYVGWWGSSWGSTGEFSVSLRPALPRQAQTLRLWRRGENQLEVVLDVRS